MGPGDYSPSKDLGWNKSPSYSMSKLQRKLNIDKNPGPG